MGFWIRWLVRSPVVAALSFNVVAYGCHPESMGSGRVFKSIALTVALTFVGLQWPQGNMHF